MRGIIFLMVGIMIISIIPQSFACSCSMASFEEHMSNADVVFEGTSEFSPQSTERHHLWEFSNVTYYKGVSKDTPDMLEIKTPIGGPSCGYGFLPETRYVIFADVNNGLNTSLCSGNMLESEINNYQRFLLDAQSSTLPGSNIIHYEAPPIAFDETIHLIPGYDNGAPIMGMVILFIVIFGIIGCGITIWIWSRRK